jgi:hypothetical protein
VFFGKITEAVDPIPLVVALPAFKAVCVETRHAQRFPSTRPVKTDRKDARGIAEMLRIGYYRPVQVKSIEAQLIRTSLPARRQIVATLLQVQGTIRGLLRMLGRKVGEIHRNLSDNRMRELLKEISTMNIATEPLLRSAGQSKAHLRPAAVQRVSDSAEFENHRAEGYKNRTLQDALIERVAGRNGRQRRVVIVPCGHGDGQHQAPCTPRGPRPRLFAWIGAHSA